MVIKLILHRDGLPSSICRISPCPKGHGGSTERGYQLAGGHFCMNKFIKIIKWIAYGWGCIWVIFGTPVLVAFRLSGVEREFSGTFEFYAALFLFLVTFVSVIIFLMELYSEGIRKGERKSKGEIF